MAIQEQIRDKIDTADDGTLFFVNDFGEYDNAYTSKILSLLSSFDVIERLSKGIYYKPIRTKFGNVYPSTEKIAKAIAERENAQILPTGELALNLLGLSTQVPTKPVYLTTGSQRMVKVGNKEIRFKSSTPRNYAYKSKLMPILVLALKALGQKNVTKNELGRIKSMVEHSSEKELIEEDIKIAPVWIKNMLKQIIKT